MVSNVIHKPIVWYFLKVIIHLIESLFHAGHQWLTPVILAIQEAEIRKITVGNQPGQIVHETLSRKNPSQKKRAGGVAQGVGPQFKPQNHQINKQINKVCFKFQRQ
jgi:hypothetical protein